MKWFFRSLNLLVAVIALFLLSQHFQKPQPPMPPPQPPVQNGQAADYPAATPVPVINLIESFQPQGGKYVAGRIALAVDKIDDAALREVLQGLLWDSEAGQELAGLLVERKLVTRDNLKALNTATFKDLAGIRKCFQDPSCFPALEKCLLTLRCCIIRCRCWPICKTCDICKACSRFPCCWSGNCSNTILIGPESSSGNYFSVKTIRFAGPGVMVSKDPADPSIGVVTIAAATPANGSITTAMLADGAVTAAKLASNVATGGPSYAEIQILVDAIHNLETDLASHKTNVGNPHLVTKEQVGLGNVTNVAPIPLDANGKINGSMLAPGSVAAAVLADSYALSNHNHAGLYAAISHGHSGADLTNGTVTAAKLVDSYAPAVHNHDASYVQKVGNNAVVLGDFYKKSGANCFNIPSGWQVGACP